VPCCVPALAPVGWLGHVPALATCCVVSACAVVRSSAQIGGFESTALSTGSFWSHAGKATPAEWRRTVERIDEVPSAALRPCCVPCCVPALATCCVVSACAVVRSLAQIGGFESTALSTGSFWSHAGKTSPEQWRVTKLRVAWVVQHNPAATGSDSFWALMSQNLSTPQFGFIAKRVVRTVASKHGNASLALDSYWAKLGEHISPAQWNDGFAAFLQMSTSVANDGFFWARFRSPNWLAAIHGMRATMVDVIRACKSNNKPVGINRAVFKAHAKANPTQIALSPAPAGPSIPRCECADMPCSCNGPWLVE
jgi:hypothetical protein